MRDSHNLSTKFKYILQYVSYAEKGRISSFTIAGCEETCDGRGGPLCVIERGETAHAELHFKVGESLHMSEDSVIGLDAPLSPLTSASSWGD